MFYRCRSTGILSRTYKGLLVIFLLLGWVSLAVAEVCVWRNPERTMVKIFPAASDYKTVLKVINEDKKARIERRLGERLDPAESKEWQYYELTDGKGRTLGYITADAEKGDLGVIEMVMGLTPDGRIAGIYVQRARERDKEFRSDRFLSQFMGKTVEDPILVGKDIKAETPSTLVKMVAFGVKKMLMFYDELGR